MNAHPLSTRALISEHVLIQTCSELSAMRSELRAARRLIEELRAERDALVQSARLLVANYYQ